MEGVGIFIRVVHLALEQGFWLSKVGGRTMPGRRANAPGFLEIWWVLVGILVFAGLSPVVRFEVPTHFRI